MEVKFNKAELNKMIVDYYKKYENTDSTVTTKVEKNYDRYDNCSCQLNFIVTTKITIYGEERVAVETLTEEEVSDIIKTMLKDEGYDVTNIDFHCGLDTKYSGYGLGETIEMIPYYRGVSAFVDNVKRKIKC